MPCRACTDMADKTIQPMIQPHQLSKSFGRTGGPAGIDLAFDQPGITAVLGPNGSGKSTLLKSILGMVIPDAGQILFHGKPIDPWEVTGRIFPTCPRSPDSRKNLRAAELIRMIESFRPQESSSAALIRDFDWGRSCNPSWDIFPRHSRKRSTWCSP